MAITPKTLSGDSYWSIRHQLTVGRGPACTHPCVECGSPAVCWSYTGDDPEERTEPTRGYRYSLDLARYRPRCRRCHHQGTTTSRRRTPRRRTVLDLDRAVWLYTAGASVPAIADLLATSPTTLYQALRAHGVDIRPPGSPRPAASVHHATAARVDHGHDR